MTSYHMTNQIQTLRSQLYAYAFSLTRDPEDARDLLQDTTFLAIKNSKKFKTGTNIKAWLFTILRNAFINNYRKSKRRNKVIDSRDGDTLVNISTATVQNDAEGHMTIQEIQGIIENLKDDLKIPFLMTVEGYKYDEIAEALNTPIGTIKSRIHFARKSLQAAIHSQNRTLEVA